MLNELKGIESNLKMLISSIIFLSCPSHCFHNKRSAHQLSSTSRVYWVRGFVCFAFYKVSFGVLLLIQSFIFFVCISQLLITHDWPVNIVDFYWELTNWSRKNTSTIWYQLVYTLEHVIAMRSIPPLNLLY